MAATRNFPKAALLREMEALRDATVAQVREIVDAGMLEGDVRAQLAEAEDLGLPDGAAPWLRKYHAAWLALRSKIAAIEGRSDADADPVLLASRGHAVASAAISTSLLGSPDFPDVLASLARSVERAAAEVRSLKEEVAALRREKADDKTTQSVELAVTEMGELGKEIAALRRAHSDEKVTRSVELAVTEMTSLKEEIASVRRTSADEKASLRSGLGALLTTVVEAVKSEMASMRECLLYRLVG